MSEMVLQPRSVGHAVRRRLDTHRAKAAARALLAILSLTVCLFAASADGSVGDAALAQAAVTARQAIVLMSACDTPAAGAKGPTCRFATAWSPVPHLFITAAHALRGHLSVILSTRTRGDHVATVALLDSAHDLAVLRSDLDLPSLDQARDAGDGDRLVAICSRRAVAYQGHPGQDGLYEGELSGAPIRAQAPSQDLLLERVAGARSVLGCSGGPVIDEAGAVAGITVAGDGGSADMVPVDVALRLVDGGA